MQCAKNVLVIAPHPDDEVLGCGGTLSRFKKENKKLFVLYITKEKKIAGFENKREKEIKKVSEILGFYKYFRLEYQTTELDLISIRELSEKIKEVVKKVNPDIVFIPFIGDVHQDHRKVAEASLIALRPYSVNVKMILMYETLSETEWGFKKFQPNLFIEITEGDLENKIKAMKNYKTEIRNPPHPRSPEMLKSLAKLRGSTIGRNFAESFMLVRSII